MTRTEFRAELHQLQALAEHRCQSALASKDQLGALRAQLAMMAAEGLLEDRLDWAEAIIEVDQIAAGIERGEGG